jgi:hypothetical protein
LVPQVQPQKVTALGLMFHPLKHLPQKKQLEPEVWLLVPVCCSVEEKVMVLVLVWELELEQ